MVRTLWTAASGMIAQQLNVDTIANNLANVNSTGYKSEKAEFKSLLYQTLQDRTTTANGNPKPIGAQVGLGVRHCSVDTSFEPGSLTETERDTDFAISGEGFFAVRGEDGQIRYTRNGNFSWARATDGGMVLSTSEGYPVLDSNGAAIHIGAQYDVEHVMFATDGALTYSEGRDDFQDLGMRIGLYQFNNPSGVTKTAGTYYLASEASGPAMEEGTLNQALRSRLVTGYLESSNVHVADEMVNLIIAQRAYEMNSKAIQTADDMMGQANSLKR